MTSMLGRRLRWHPWSIALGLVVHAVRTGLWRSLPRPRRRAVNGQEVLTWRTCIPGGGNSRDIVSGLRQAGLRVDEGGNAFYLPPQPGLAEILGPAADRYPPGSGFKILRDLRTVDKAHYLHPERQTPVRRWLIGTPRHQLITASYLHRLGLGPRVWDLCVLRAGDLSMPTFVVQHIDGTPPDSRDCTAFLERLRVALATTELRMTIPNWQRSKDFRSPGCNGNLLRDASGTPTYIDFQNFSVRDPRRILAPPAGGRVTRADPGTPRFDAALQLLQEHGVDLRHRLVLDVGPGAGARLHRALGAGAWWAMGWDQPAAARRAQALAVAGGFTRAQIVPADLDDACDIAASIPEWLGRHLTGAIVFLFMARPHIGIARALATLPWRALLCAGPRGPSPAEASEHIRVLTAPGVRVAPAAHRGAGSSGAAPPLLLIRDVPEHVSARPVLRH
jgi:hypothetical protein